MIGPIDRIFTRIGASDDLARRALDLHGRDDRRPRTSSTTRRARAWCWWTRSAAAPAPSTACAGAGPSRATSRRRAGAHAVRDALLRADRARRRNRPAAVNVHLAAAEHGGGIVFLHQRPSKGPPARAMACRSRGWRACRRPCCGTRARDLQSLEQHQQTLLPASPQKELSFSPEAAAPSAEQSLLREQLAQLDVDSLSPRAALDVLYELAEFAKQP